MKTHHDNHVCKQCRTQIGIAITTVGTRRTKFKAILYCEACSFPVEIFWDSDPVAEDPDQLGLFPPVVKL